MWAFKKIFICFLFLLSVSALALVIFFYAELIAQISLLNLCLFFLVLVSFFLLGLGSGFFCCWLLNCIKASAKLNQSDDAGLSADAQTITPFLPLEDRGAIFYIPEYKANFQINRNEQAIKIVLSADKKD